MKKTAIAIALCSTAISMPAMARDNQTYAEIGFGPALAEDFDISLANPDETDLASLDEDYGFDGQLLLGHDFGTFRVEIEGSYREFDHDTLTLADNGRMIEGPQGSSSALSIMGNALVDFGPDDGLQGFIGAGAGPARIKHDISLGNNQVFEGSDWEFAWQLLAGVRAPLTDTMDVGLRYRFFNAPDYNLTADEGSSLVPAINTDWSSHSILGTLTMNFGGEAVGEGGRHKIAEHCDRLAVDMKCQPLQPLLPGRAVKAFA
ncbi:MAG: outer membrane protein, partial [Qipengyuania vulgaris]